MLWLYGLDMAVCYGSMVSSSWCRSVLILSIFFMVPQYTIPIFSPKWLLFSCVCRFSSLLDGRFCCLHISSCIALGYAVTMLCPWQSSIFCCLHVFILLTSLYVLPSAYVHVLGIIVCFAVFIYHFRLIARAVLPSP